MKTEMSRKRLAAAVLKLEERLLLGFREAERGVWVIAPDGKKFFISNQTLEAERQRQSAPALSRA
jgi:hypothetical protein